MRDYLLIIWLAGSPAGIQSEMVTRQQCYATVEIYRSKDLKSPVRVSCVPPHARYETREGWGGVAATENSWEDDRDDDRGSVAIPPRRSSAPDADRKAP